MSINSTMARRESQKAANEAIQDKKRQTTNPIAAESVSTRVLAAVAVSFPVPVLSDTTSVLASAAAAIAFPYHTVPSVTVPSLQIRTVSVDVDFHANRQAVEPIIDDAHGRDDARNGEAHSPAMVLLSHEHYQKIYIGSCPRRRQSSPTSEQSRKKKPSHHTHQDEVTPSNSIQQHQPNNGVVSRMERKPTDISDIVTINPRGEDISSIRPCVVQSTTTAISSMIVIDQATEALQSYLLAECDSTISMAIYRVLDAPNENCHAYQSVRTAIQRLVGSTKYTTVAGKAQRIVDCCGEACIKAMQR